MQDTNSIRCKHDGLEDKYNSHGTRRCGDTLKDNSDGETSGSEMSREEPSPIIDVGVPGVYPSRSPSGLKRCVSQVRLATDSTRGHYHFVTNMAHHHVKGMTMLLSF